MDQAPAPIPPQGSVEEDCTCKGTDLPHPSGLRGCVLEESVEKVFGPMYASPELEVPNGVIGTVPWRRTRNLARWRRSKAKETQ